MIPPSPMQLAVFGSTLYGELWLGLCRALAAPWLDPCWLARAGEGSGKPNPTSREATGRQDKARPRPARPPHPEPGAGRVIEVPAGRWRARRARSA